MQELDEIFVRKQIRKILNEQIEDVTWGDIIPPSGQEFYDTFIGPFVDVYNVTKVAFKDTADSILSVVEAVFTFDPAKKKDLMVKFRNKREKYKQEMTAAMKTTDEALSSPDANLIMFMMNPGAWIGAEMVREAADTATPFTDYVGDKFGNMGTMMGIGSDYIPPPKGGIAGGQGLLGQLKNLFFGPDMGITTGDLGQIGLGAPVAGVAGGPVRTESLDEIDELERVLKEGDDESKDEKQSNKGPLMKDLPEEEVQAAVDDWLSNSGAGEKIDEYASEIIESKKVEAEEVRKQYVDVIEALNAVSKAQSLEEISQVIPQLEQGGIDLKPQLAEVEQMIQEQQETVKAGGDDAKEIIEQLRQTPDGKALPEDTPAEGWFPLIEQSTIGAAFANAVDGAKKQGIGEMLGFVAEMPRDELEQISKVSPLGKEFAEIIFQLENDLLSVEV